MGTLQSTKDRSWTWILAAPMETVQKAGVGFNPNTRTVTAIQGDAASGSALEVIVRTLMHICAWFMCIMMQPEVSALGYCI